MSVNDEATKKLDQLLSENPIWGQAETDASNAQSGSLSSAHRLSGSAIGATLKPKTMDASSRQSGS